MAGEMSDYDGFAQLYDWEHCGFDDDLALYRNLARRCDGPVLDVGCGSGRVTLALAQIGVDVVGIDCSAGMLDIAQERLAGADLPGRVQLWHRDICAWTQPAHFALAVFSLNGFLHLLTTERQLAALENIWRSLLPGGILIVDVPNPHAVFSPAQDGQLVLRSSFFSPQGREIWCFVNTRTDLAEQTQHLTLIYDQAVAGDQGLVQRTRVDTDVRYVYRYEMIALLARAGFQIDALYGSYDLEPYTVDSQQMLFVAYKKAG